MAGSIRYVNPSGGVQPEQVGEASATEMRKLPPVGIPIHKDQKKNKFSQTPGTSKVESCQASPFDKSHAKRSGSFKWRTYGSWCYRMDRKAGRN